MKNYLKITVVMLLMLNLTSCSGKSAMRTVGYFGPAEIAFFIIGIILIVAIFTISSKLDKIIFQLKENNEALENIANNMFLHFNNTPQQTTNTPHSHPEPQSEPRAEQKHDVRNTKFIACPDCGRPCEEGTWTCPNCGCPLT